MIKYKNTKQIARIYYYLYIIKYINSQLQTINSNIYSYDSVGNKLTKQDPTGAHNYTYDNTYQLINATHPTIPQEQFAYDQVGNRTNTTVDAANKLLQDPNASYQYDNNGNRYIKTQTDGTITYYSYDYEGRLTRVETQKPGLTTIAVYKYDALGRRIEKNVDGVVTKYLYSNEGLIAEYDANNNLKKTYGWLPNGIWGTGPLYMTENNQTYYYHNDGLGTPQKMTDASGNVVWSATYTAFGEATVDASSTITNNLRFAGQYFDQETGTHYNLFRVYDPKTGTYISKDPIGFDGGDVNLYRYIFNNSINLIDPLGLSSLLYDSDTQTISLNIGDKLIDKFPAGNNTTADSKGPWAKGVYPYSHYVSHPESGSTGPYGSHGNFVFDVPGRTGMGVHSGRRSPRDRTEGCIRTTDEGTLSILIMHLVDPITHITVCGGNAPCSSGSSIFNILGKTGKAYKFK